MTKTVKLLEIRDVMTFIPAMAIRVSGEDGYLMRRAGFGPPLIYLITLSTALAHYDPYGWTGRARTMPVAHQYIEAHFDELTDGSVVDVQFILGETSTPELSEEVTATP